MVIRFILRYLANSEQLIQKIAESYPIRRAAQLSVMLAMKSTNLMEIIRNSPYLQNTAGIVRGFSGRLKKELKDGFSEMNQELKKRKSR